MPHHVPTLLLGVPKHTRHFPFSTCVEGYSTDDCCDDTGVAQAQLAPTAVEIARSYFARAALVGLQRLEFQPGKNPCVIESMSENCSLANHACKLLTTDTKKAAQEMGIPGMIPAVGMDTEWKVWTSEPQTIATVQVSSPSGTTYIFHVKFAGGNKIVFAKALRTMLENGHVLKVGATPLCLFSFALICTEMFELLFSMASNTFTWR